MTTHTPNKYSLNADQQNAAEKFLEFLFSPEKEFNISGPAGVGKTYLMNYITDNTMQRYQEMCQILGEKPKYTGVVMTATTNKAAEVLGNSVKRPTSTVHSFFGLRVQNDFVTGKANLTKTPKWKVQENLIIFVDEASMIDSTLWKHLQDGTKDCKLVYVGDRHQLAPVAETLSPVYLHNNPMVELLQPMRNSNQPALMEVCAQLRETVNSGTFQPIKLVPGVIDLLDDSRMQEEIARYFTDKDVDARILAYTNKRVIAYNQYIRSLRKLPVNSFQIGERLVSNNAFHTHNKILSVEADVRVLHNYGPNTIRLDNEHETDLDVDYLRIEDQFGTVYDYVPVPLNREHYDALIKYYSKQKAWNIVFRLKERIADLRPRDAATVHKAQGSTYDTVFIDLGNISTCNIPDQVARMLYVAFSRARSRVFLYGNLAPKYGGVAH